MSYDYYLAVATAAGVTRQQAKKVLLAAAYIPRTATETEKEVGAWVEWSIGTSTEDPAPVRRKDFATHDERDSWIDKMINLYRIRFNYRLPQQGWKP